MTAIAEKPLIGISTWLTLDGSGDETAYPSVGLKSSERSFQDIYWRCIGLYFLTARIHNPTAPLIIFCNKNLARVAPRKVFELLTSLNVMEVQLELSHRLPRGSVTQWGNVFYELDVIQWFSHSNLCDGLVITDSDCVWRSGFDGFEQRLIQEKCLIYTLNAADQKNYQGDVLINGMSCIRMQDVLFDVFGKQVSPMRHNGGEFLGVTKQFCIDNRASVDKLWAFAVADAWKNDSIKTEEHFWNIIAKLNDIPEFSANDIVRRMWTNFEDQNIINDDLTLPLWHLPAEKKYGFRRMWEWFIASRKDWSEIDPGELNAALEHFMGVPRRSAKKMLLDVAEKVTERIKAYQGM